jgi:C-terminal processing protease CtpA/Prc
MLAMSPGEFMKRPNLTYAQAGSLMLYLRDRGLLRNFYEAYKRTYDTDPTGRRALEQTSGSDLAGFEAAWTKWLLDRPPAPFAGGAALFLGAQLAPAGGGMTVLLVAPNGPAAVAGVEPRDVILSVNGKPVKDYPSLRPAIGTYSPGKELVLRVRRGGKESDVTVKLQSISSAPTPAPQ